MMRTAPAPMLATLGAVADVHEEEEWAFEMKWDGIRAIAIVDPGRVALTSRNNRNLTPAYPELSVVEGAVGPRHAVLDGEIVAFDPRGRPDFGLLQSRMNLTREGEIREAASRVPVSYLVFDLLELDGRNLLRERYDDRRAALQELLGDGRGTVQVPPAFNGDLADAVATSLRLGLEGVVAKERDGTYSPGRRSGGWLKIKHHRAQEVVVAGWKPGQGARSNGIGSLLLAVPDGDGLRYAGKVGTGFSEAQLHEILSRLETRARKTVAITGVPAAEARDAHWVRPDLVAEVEFAEWTPGGRLRQPAWRGWRPDKAVVDIHFE